MKLKINKTLHVTKYDDSLHPVDFTDSAGFNYHRIIQLNTRAMYVKFKPYEKGIDSFILHDGNNIFKFSVWLLGYTKAFKDCVNQFNNLNSQYETQEGSSRGT
jgi:hypothetical protein